MEWHQQILHRWWKRPQQVRIPPFRVPEQERCVALNRVTTRTEVARHPITRSLTSHAGSGLGVKTHSIVREQAEPRRVAVQQRQDLCSERREDAVRRLRQHLTERQ